MPVPKSKMPTPRVLLREVVFDRLLEAIVSGDLAPGEVLKDQEIEEWAGASRTPVREAIDRLASLGFIEVLPQKETRVAKVDLPRFADQLETLRALYCGVVGDAIPLLEPSDVDVLTELIHELRRPEGLNANTPVAISDLLPSFLRVYGNTVVIKLQEALMPHVRRGINARGEDDTYYMTGPELDRLTKAIRNRDSDTVTDVVDEYFDRLISHVRQSIAAGKD